jgi:nucleoside-specific outer membrane channel protein Tsx
VYVRTAKRHRYAVSAIGAIALGSSVLACAQDAPPDTSSEHFFIWTDSSITGLFYGWGFEVDPSEQSTLTFEHAHASRIGDLFMFVDATQFHSANGADDGTWYGEIGPRLSFGKLFNTDLSHSFFKRSLFEFKDLLFAAQYERGEDPDVAEAVLLGIGLDLDVREAGILGGLGKFNFLQVNVYARSELTEGVDQGFNDAQVTVVASYPFNVGRVSWNIDGYFDWVLGIGSEDWSYHFNPQVVADIGVLAGHAAKKFYAGVELDFWWNKYQIPSTAAFETNQQAVSLMAKYHF